jgi:hypothetical protein
MFNWIKFRWQQHKIERWMDKISLAHKDAEKMARANGQLEAAFVGDPEHRLVERGVDARDPVDRKFRVAE